jgi:hypothetical protein
MNQHDQLQLALHYDQLLQRYANAEPIDPDNPRCPCCGAPVILEHVAQPASVHIRYAPRETPAEEQAA